MRKTTVTNKIENISLSKECVTILLFIFVFGISTGVFFEVMMSSDMKSTMQTYLQNLLQAPTAQNSNAFLSLVGSSVSNVFVIAFITLCGYTRFPYPASALILFIKGISLGYSCALILETLALKGVFVIFLSLFPENTLLIPAIILSANLAVSKSAGIGRKKNKSIGRGLISADAPYLYANIFLCLMAVAGCILQSIFLPMAARII